MAVAVVEPMEGPVVQAAVTAVAVEAEEESLAQEQTVLSEEVLDILPEELVVPVAEEVGAVVPTTKVELVAQVDQVQSSYTTNWKLFAVIDNNIVVDGWLASSFEEAQKDNPNKTIIELTVENSPIPYLSYCDGKKFYEMSCNG